MADIVIVDPYIEDVGNYGYLENDIYKAVEDIDALILVKAHADFESIDFKRIKDLMKIPIIVDGKKNI